MEFGGLWNKKYVITFKTKMLIYQSKANLDEKMFLVKSHIFRTEQFEKCLKKFLW